ncbi:hypothetical protein BTW08_15980 [Salinicola sp. MH3R3-1]|uniref:hypothetical protein n=1 Tax=Salinicola sp. MH3R3-1 TaxID=1928762 RepID=UPI00094E502B|nr:hypothetical protein [Salinicola sp. MH3R3-1]OLO06654.1 hypothetical protein BTW08_15980 [Salinicola sp. MH3R3-1]
MVEIGAALTALRTAYDTARAAKDVNDAAALNAAVSDIMERLTSAQFTLTEVLQEHHALLDQVRQLREAQAREARFDRYHLEQTRRGYFVLRLDERQAGPYEPNHAICPRCKEDGKLAVMMENDEVLECITCRYSAWKEYPDPIVG